MNVPDYDAYFKDGRRLETPGEPQAPSILRLHKAGAVHVTTGSVVACDPLMAVQDLKAFDVKVPDGDHTVTLCVIEYHKKNKLYDQRVALARLDFGKGPVKSWALATLPGQNVKALKKDQYFGYASESGYGCFTDALGAEALALALDTDDEFEPGLLKSLDGNYQDTRSWTTVALDPESGANAVVFTSGDGDGNFPTFVGADAKGKPVALVTDFLLIAYQ